MPELPDITVYIEALESRVMDAPLESLRIGHPLQQTLKAKQQQLKTTLKAFERVADYQVIQFSTASTFYIADLYTSLSTSLMESAPRRNPERAAAVIACVFISATAPSYSSFTDCTPDSVN